MTILMKILNKCIGNTAIYQKFLRSYLKRKNQVLTDTLTVINR